MENLSILNGKKIILGVTGSIAAYKSPLIVRELVKKGADVSVIMTKSAEKFVTKTTLENLSHNNVIIDMFDESAQTRGAWHIELSHSCDAMIIAPCSATTLSKIATGICDNALTTVALSLPSNVPLILAPAMDTTMWTNPAIQRAIKQLESDGVIVLPPTEGELSSGLVGLGRLPEINDIVRFLEVRLANWGGKSRYQTDISYSNSDKFNQKVEEKTSEYDPFATPIESVSDAVDKDKWNVELELDELKKKRQSEIKSLQNIKILVNAGPTREKIDDVRYISNYSSGKMGFAIAEVANSLGAEVTLVAGPVSLNSSKEINRIDVVSAEEMYQSVVENYKKADIIILSAAVADFTVEKTDGKIKKENLGDELSLKLIKTKDILKSIGKVKSEKQILVGFALESQNLIENAKVKLAQKNCDLIIANSANKEKSGFGGDYNTITIIGKNGYIKDYLPMTKYECAKVILEHSIELLNKIN